MKNELIRELATVLIQWGFGFIVFGGATVLIGFIILAYLDMSTIKK